jgi:hypothetical protein
MTLLHAIGNFFRDQLQTVPLPAVRGLFLLLLFAILLWVLRLPRSETTPPNRESRWDENLKLWASVALVIQILIYSLV